MMNNKEIDYTARPVPGDYEGRSHRACVWYNRARAAFDLATLDALTTDADKAADRVPTEAYEKARKSSLTACSVGGLQMQERGSLTTTAAIIIPSGSKPDRLSLQNGV